MNPGRYVVVVVDIAITLALGCNVQRSEERQVMAEKGRQRPAGVIRIADLEIHPAQLDEYLALVREEMETSVRVEPGVIAIYAVADKDNPAKLTFFEMYVDEAAYLAHRDAPHFKKYVEGTKDMIRTRVLREMRPVQLSAKP